MYYLIKTPWWLKRLYSAAIWSMPATEKAIYLSFDDGPHPVATPFILQQLAQYNAKATFFCIGKNVQRYPQIFQDILNAGHRVGNHSYDHLNGWKNNDQAYAKNVEAAAELIHSHLFRPPYGKIRHSQLKLLSNPPFNLRTVMWNVLSADFDERLSGKDCLNNVLKYTKPGSIVVFHDSDKALIRLLEALPGAMAIWADEGYSFKAIE